MDQQEKALAAHKAWNGKFEIRSRAPLGTREDLATAYTPGVAAPCLEIRDNPDKVYDYCRKGNYVAVVTDGSAILGLGNIGPVAGMPVMEGKAILFKEFADVDAVPICLGTQDPQEIVRTVELMAPGFGGINLEDISAPRCFEVERALTEKLKIPVFHDDQHGTAVVVLAAVRNVTRLTGKKLKDLKIVVNGAGAAGNAITHLLAAQGVGEIVVVDQQGALHKDLPDMDPYQQELAALTNPRNLTGSLGDVIDGADVFIGVSAPGVLTKDMVARMAPQAAVFAMANPVPEIDPEEAREAGAYIVGTGRSDHPNQINNVLAFPGIFRGALDVRAEKINDAMLLAAADAIASMVSDEQLSPDYVMPDPVAERIAPAVAAAVARAARESGVAGN
ncbi:MAG: NADP-dependent malic enzyme [Clostridia bacterium]|nr:NADP-dependent malic enzyme [Clostridia bacterium]